MTLARYLSSLGYGSRKAMEALLASGHVRHADGRRLGAHDPWTHEVVRVEGAPLDPPPGSVILLHKPVGYVCSTVDVNPVVFDLLPPRFPHRRPPMAPVGRLDRDTSGLLVVTDDGALNHRLTSPRHHAPKTYVADLQAPLTGTEGDVFASGTLRLAGEERPLAPARLEVLGPTRAAITVGEGRYHQVRRMFAAVGHHVTALHRTRIGALDLGDLPPGAWRVATAEDRRRLEDPLAGLGLG